VRTYHINEEEVSENKVIKDMVGRDLSNMYPQRKGKINDNIKFEVKNWSAYHPQDTNRKILHNINVNVKQGEIVGIAGLMGAGRTEFAMSVFGKSYGKKISGKMYVDDQEIQVKNVNDAIKNGIAYVSEDRTEYILILMNSVKQNLTMSNVESRSNNNILNDGKEIIEAEKLVDSMNIKAPSIEQETENLSGGNQQKVVIG